MWSVCLGKGLCMLTKEDCLLRAPRDGDVIHNILTVLVNNLPRIDEGQLTYTYLLTYLQLPVICCPHRRSNTGNFPPHLNCGVTLPRKVSSILEPIMYRIILFCYDFLIWERLLKMTFYFTKLSGYSWQVRWANLWFWCQICRLF